MNHTKKVYALAAALVMSIALIFSSRPELIILGVVGIWTVTMICRVFVEILRED